MESVEQLVAELTGKDIPFVYHCLKELEARSAVSGEVYPYFGLFAKMIDSPSSYQRARGLRLIAANAKWDAEHKIDGILENYLSHILDEKPTVARQCIQALPLLAGGRPELADRIRSALREADPGCYKDSMEPLVRGDILKALNQIG